MVPRTRQLGAQGLQQVPLQGAVCAAASFLLHLNMRYTIQVAMQLRDSEITWALVYRISNTTHT